jgi:beta-N-acetylhexosaminidase
VGSVILFTRNYADSAQLSRLVADIHAVRSPALIVAVDQEGGRVQRFRPGFSGLPAPRRIGHEFDVDAKAGIAFARSMGWLMAAELRAHGVDLSFAPCDPHGERSHRRRVSFQPGSWRNSRSPTWAA